MYMCGCTFGLNLMDANVSQQTSKTLSLSTDAAGSLGYGDVFGSHWCYRKWPKEWLHTNIAVLELYPTVLILYLLGDYKQNRSILYLTDNEALVYTINKQSCRDKSLMFFVRKLVLICLKNNVFPVSRILGRITISVPALDLQALGPRAHGSEMDRHSIISHMLPCNWRCSSNQVDNVQPTNVAEVDISASMEYIP